MLFPAILVVLVLSLPATAFAVSKMTISSAGDGVFLVQGAGIENASALEINVGYDTATLANPRVVKGPLISGAMTAVNPNVPGTVRMVIIRLAPVHGSGVIATLTFDRTGSSPGKIMSFSARLANTHGTTLPALVQIKNPTDVATTASDPPQSTEDASGKTGIGTAGTGSTAAPTIIVAGQPGETGESDGTPDIPATTEREDQPAEPQTAEPSEEPLLTARKTDSLPESRDTTTATTMAEAKIFTQQSILDRFREHQGERSPRAFLSLFEQDSIIWCHQEPAIALSDGTTAVQVTFISTPGEKTSSDVAVMGARLVSMKKDPHNTNTWIIELVPEKGEYRTSLAVSQGNVTMVYPLTIAPKFTPGHSRSGKMTEADFYRAVTERDVTTAAKFDANNDGKRDYIDDYIITANYLAALPRQINTRGRTD